MVAFKHESIWGHGFNSLGTPVYLKNSPATAAVEVMMVFLPGGLVMRRLARNLNRDDLALFDQILDRPIDGCDSQPRFEGSGYLLDLLGSHRPVNIRKNLGNGVALLRLSFHTSSRLGGSVQISKVAHAHRMDLDRTR